MLPAVLHLAPFLLSIASAPGAQLAEAEERPNIIVIYADDHSEAAISSYGSIINQTPNIDQLAADGMRFTQSFVANSICGPARGTLLTGTHSHTNGRVNNTSAFNTELPTWGREMRGQGYRTAMVGKWHLPGKPLPEDFDYWVKTGGYYANGLQSSEGKIDRQGYTVDLITDLGLEWIDQEQDEEKPFVLWLSHNAVHRTWMPGPEHLDLYRGVEIPEPATLLDDYVGRSPGAEQAQMRISKDLFPAYDLHLPITGEQILDNAAKGRLAPMTAAEREAWDAAYDPENEAFAAANLSGDGLTRWNYQRYIQDYLRCVAALDDSVGRVREFLEANDLADNTIVIYTSDQGFFLGEHGWYDKRWMYEPSLRTPLIIHWPGVTAPGSTSDKMVQNIDMAPTFLEMAGQEIPSTMQGASLLPLLSNTLEEQWRSAIYYHYQEYNEGRIAHRVAEHYGIRTERYKLFYVYRHDAWEFYDLESDPDEMNNLIDDPKHADEIRYLKDRLWNLRLQFGDQTGPNFQLEPR
jgi:arylsulfatase A-like enzyme